MRRVSVNGFACTPSQNIVKTSRYLSAAMRIEKRRFSLCPVPSCVYSSQIYSGSARQGLNGDFFYTHRILHNIQRTTFNLPFFLISLFKSLFLLIAIRNSPIFLSGFPCRLKIALSGDCDSSFLSSIMISQEKRGESLWTCLIFSILM